MTVSRARRLSSRNPTKERSAIGSSRCHSASSSRSGWSSAEVSSSWWSVPRRSGHLPRLAQLVGGGVLDEADREGLHRAVGDLGHQRRDQARVEAAAQHHAERHVADHPRARRRAQQLQQALAVLLPGGADRLRRRVPGAPVLALLDRRIRRRRPGRRRAAACGRRRRACAAPARSRGQEQLGGIGVEARLDQAAGDQRLDLRGEGQPAGRSRRRRAASRRSGRGRGPAAGAAGPRARSRTSPAGDRRSPARAPRRGGRSSRRRRRVAKRWPRARSSSRSSRKL